MLTFKFVAKLFRIGLIKKLLIKLFKSPTSPTFAVTMFISLLQLKLLLSRPAENFVL